MAVNLDLVKQNMRIHDDSEDQFLTHLIEAATTLVTSHSGQANDETAPSLYEQACLFLIGEWFTHREGLSTEAVKSIPRGFDFLLDQIRTPESFF